MGQRSIAAIGMPVGLEGIKALSRGLKLLLHRVRPSAMASDLSFPSSHTARFCFCVLLVACIIGPRLVADSGSLSASQSTDDDPESSGSSGSNGSANVAVPCLAMILIAWLAMGSLRVSADAHWTSDTVGGAALGTSMAAALEITFTVGAAVFSASLPEKK